MSSSGRILPPTFADLGPSDPSQIGGYQLLGKLGAGGMGTAYLGETAGHWVVIKVLKNDLAEDPTFRARLRRELESLSRVTGPGAVRVIKHDLDSSTPWFAMEYVEGQTLADRVETAGPLRGNTLVDFARQLAQRIEEIHKAGITHRDIKPANIVISPTGPRIIDFGIAVLDERTAMTSTGVLVGTLSWTAPEQVAGDSVGPSADVHAWGLSVLYAATGQSPFAADTAANMVYKVVHMQPTVPSGLPGDLSPAIEAALRKDPAQRPSLQDLASGQIGAVPPSRPFTESQTQIQAPPRRSRRLLAAVVAGVLVVAVAAGAGIAVVASMQSTSASTPEPVQVTVTAAPAPAPATEVASTSAEPTSEPPEVSSPEPQSPVGYEEQKTANALLTRINRGQWSSIPELCTPPSLCTRQFVDFFQPRFMSGQFLRGDVGMLYSCADPVPRGWEGGCTSPGRWLAQFDWTCSKNGSQAVQREVGYFEFDYSQGARISAFEPVTVIDAASQCTG